VGDCENNRTDKDSDNSYFAFPGESQPSLPKSCDRTLAISFAVFLAIDRKLSDPISLATFMPPLIAADIPARPALPYVTSLGGMAK